MPKQTKAQFLVTVTADTEASVDELREYIKTAVENWTGGMDPDSMLGCINITAKVSRGQRLKVRT